MLIKFLVLSYIRDYFLGDNTNSAYVIMYFPPFGYPPWLITENRVMWTGRDYHARVWRLRVTLAWRQSNGIAWRYAIYMVELLCFGLKNDDFLTKIIQIADLNMW